MSEPVAFMKQKVEVEYRVRTSPVQARYARRLAEGKLTGHRCSECGRVYVPPRGYCPLCCVETRAERDEVELPDRGTVTTFTVITPIQYKGQEEREPYALASVLLDGASSTLGQQRIGEIPPESVRTGMRVEAEWAGGQIAHWAPSGEADVPLAALQDHLL